MSQSSLRHDPHAIYPFPRSVSVLFCSTQRSCLHRFTVKGRFFGDFMQVDQFDRKIIAALADDGRLPTVELANRVGLSASACTRRIQNLEAAGVIAGYRAL